VTVSYQYRNFHPKLVAADKKDTLVLLPRHHTSYRWWDTPNIYFECDRIQLRSYYMYYWWEQTHSCKPCM